MRAADWQALREVRLRALADAPDAFGTVQSEALARPDEWWRDWAERSAIESRAGDVPRLGRRTRRSGSRADLRRRRAVHVISMWTDPARRGAGSGAALLDAAVAFAGDADVFLSVTEDNDAARRLYERYGFVATGLAEPLGRTGLPIHELRLEPMKELDERIDARGRLRARRVRRGRAATRPPTGSSCRWPTGAASSSSPPRPTNLAGWLRREHEVYGALAAVPARARRLGRRRRAAAARARGPERRRLDAALGRGRESTRFARRSPSSRRSRLRRTRGRSRETFARSVRALACRGRGSGAVPLDRPARRALARALAADDSRGRRARARRRGARCAISTFAATTCASATAARCSSTGTGCRTRTRTSTSRPGSRACGVEGGPQPWEVLPDERRARGVRRRRLGGGGRPAGARDGSDRSRRSSARSSRSRSTGSIGSSLVSAAGRRTARARSRAARSRRPRSPP